MAHNNNLFQETQDSDHGLEPFGTMFSLVLRELQEVLAKREVKIQYILLLLLLL